LRKESAAIRQSHNSALAVEASVDS